MDIKNLKDAEELLTNSTDSQILFLLSNEINKLYDLNSATNHEALKTIETFFANLYKEFAQKYPTIDTRALQWVVFNIIPDEYHPMAYLRTKYHAEDTEFFNKCKSLCELNVTAEQFGADENYTIPLRAAIVELSVIDSYKSPLEKLNCLCGAYDLLFAELKSAMVSLISASDNENQFPIVNNNDIMPVLMVTIIKSKLIYMFSTLEYIQTFFHQLQESHVVCQIFKAFQSATDEISKINLQTIKLNDGKLKPTLDLVQIIQMTSSSEEIYANSLVDQENRRVLNLITTSTAEDFSPY